MKSHRGVGGGGGEGVLSIFYNGLYEKTPPERGIFFTCRFEVYEREGISLVEVYEWVGKSVYILYFRSVKWPKQMLTYAFYGCEKFQNRLRYPRDKDLSIG